MTDNDNRLIEAFFSEAAQQQIEDNGFTQRVMDRLPDTGVSLTHRLSRLWTLFCVVIGGVLFLVFNGWESLKASLRILFETAVTSLSVFVTTAPTADLHLDPVVVLLLLAFLLVFLPYQTFRKLSATL